PPPPPPPPHPATPPHAPPRPPAPPRHPPPRPAAPPPRRAAPGPRPGAAPYRGGGFPGRDGPRPAPVGGPRPLPTRYSPPPPPPARQGRGKGHRRDDSRSGYGRGEGRPGMRENLKGDLRPVRRRRAAAPPVRNTDRPVVIDGPVTVGALAQRMGVTGAELVRALMNLGVMAALTQEIDADTAALAVTEMGYTPDLRAPAPTLEEELEGAEEDRPEDLVPRAPVVTVMGHVDHGKTSLLDAIRRTNVTAGEAGGITQHIGAYTAQVNGRKVVFLDTPGHEAFTAMRARGAQVTDVVILVVAADDGPMPQTVEAINHARSAGVPIVVAINKVDLPGAQPDRVKQALTEHGLVPEEWGGDTLMVPVSAVKGTGLDDLLEAVLLVADMRDLKANPNKRARATVVEGRLDRGRGPVATVLVMEGTLHVGDAFVVGATAGRVRAMFSDQGESVREAGPATPVEVLGLAEVPEAGDRLVAVDDERKARELAEQRRQARRTGSVGAGPEGLGFEELFQRSQASEVRTLLLVLKTDVHGSLEALSSAIETLSTEEVPVRIVHRGVGAITESDVMLAAAAGAEVVGFHVRPEPKAAKAAEANRVEIRVYRVIYELLDDLRARLAGLRKPVVREEILGRAEVRQIFHVPRGGTVAGLMVTDGRIPRSAQVRLVRDGVVVHEGRIASLRRFKDDVREVAAGYECGLMLERYQDVREGDVIEAFALQEVAQEA
ncbi:MAG: translation initiation factor IF-2, partial [Firmicutes bacterium]|nr:translation initiation factor IF-2 [Bacillota bacterium]